MSRSHVFALLLGLGAGGAAAAGGELPEPLAELCKARESLRTGQINWVVRCNAPRQDTITYFWYTPGGERYYSALFTPQECAVQDLGNAEGVVWEVEKDCPDPEVAYRPKYHLWWENATWEYRDGTLVAEVFPRYRSMPDPRGVGLTPALASAASEYEWIRKSPVMYDHQVKMEGGLCRIIAACRYSDDEIHYLLDPQRGWNPVQVTYISGGRTVSEVRNTLKEFDGVWFPEKVEIYELSFADGQQPLYVIEVLSASFNQPDHPNKLTPASIGIEPGISVLVYEGGAGRLGKYTPMGWDGKRCVDLDELRLRQRAGEFRPGPRVQREIDRILAMGFDRELWRDEWENYVRRFIERYRLNEEQAERAWRILRDCVERAERHMSACDEELLKIRAEVRRETGPSGAHEGPSTRLAELKQRTLKLLSPMMRIFYGELVPRLERIPTRAQREAVAQREEAARARPADATSAPATQPAVAP